MRSEAIASPSADFQMARLKYEPAVIPPDVLFAHYLESMEILARRGAAIQAAYARHADEYDEARRWWDRIIEAGRAGEFLDANGHSIDLIRSPMQTLRKWWIRDGRPR